MSTKRPIRLLDPHRRIEPRDFVPTDGPTEALRFANAEGAAPWLVLPSLSFRGLPALTWFELWGNKEAVEVKEWVDNGWREANAASFL